MKYPLIFILLYSFASFADANYYLQNVFYSGQNNFSKKLIHSNRNDFENDASGEPRYYLDTYDLYNKVRLDNQRVKNLTIRINEYRSTDFNPNTGKTILIIPPTGGSNVIDDSYATTFIHRRNNIKVIVICYWSGMDEYELHPRSHDDYAIIGAGVTKTVADFSKSNHISVLGNSSGGIIASLFAAYDHRVKAVSYVVAGRGIHEILSKSNLPLLENLKNNRKDYYGITSDNQYLYFLKDYVQIDGADICGRLSRIPSFLVLSYKDQKVPTQNQYDLYNCVNPTIAYGVDESHEAAIAKTFLHLRKDINSFFARY